ncbi:MAG TPA: hypothetical protein RMG48_14045, partial [Myxococcales bacterium LLY-WYZ-16_1]|nr:hypothetical protein [Myxococcales bacterium LLY-WYZ-16_1]
MNPYGTSPGKALGDHTPLRGPLIAKENPLRRALKPAPLDHDPPRVGAFPPSERTQGVPEDAPRRRKLAELPEARPRMSPGVTPRP